MILAKPEPLADVYSWLDLLAWLRVVVPKVARDLERVIAASESSNGALEVIDLDDFERGYCGDALSADSIAWLRANIAARSFRVWVYW